MKRIIVLLVGSALLVAMTTPSYAYTSIDTKQQIDAGIATMQDNAVAIPYPLKPRGNGGVYEKVSPGCWKYSFKFTATDPLPNSDWWFKGSAYWCGNETRTKLSLLGWGQDGDGDGLWTYRGKDGETLLGGLGETSAYRKVWGKFTWDWGPLHYEERGFVAIRVWPNGDKKLTSWGIVD